MIDEGADARDGEDGEEDQLKPVDRAVHGVVLFIDGGDC
jgi:hypothetical protein